MVKDILNPVNQCIYEMNESTYKASTKSLDIELQSLLSMVTFRFNYRPLSRSGHFVSGELKTFVYAWLHL